MADVLPIKGHREYERMGRRSVAGCLRHVREFHKPKTVLVIGYDHSGELFVNSVPNDPAEAMWLMALATRKLTG